MDAKTNNNNNNNNAVVTEWKLDGAVTAGAAGAAQAELTRALPPGWTAKAATGADGLYVATARALRALDHDGGHPTALRQLAAAQLEGPRGTACWGRLLGGDREALVSAVRSGAAGGNAEVAALADALRRRVYVTRTDGYACVDGRWGGGDDYSNEADDDEQMSEDAEEDEEDEEEDDPFDEGDFIIGYHNGYWMTISRKDGKDGASGLPELATMGEKHRLSGTVAVPAAPAAPAEIEQKWDLITNMIPYEATWERVLGHTPKRLPANDGGTYAPLPAGVWMVPGERATEVVLRSSARGTHGAILVSEHRLTGTNGTFLTLPGYITKPDGPDGEEKRTLGQHSLWVTGGAASEEALKRKKAREEANAGKLTKSVWCFLETEEKLSLSDTVAAVKKWMQAAQIGGDRPRMTVTRKQPKPAEVQGYHVVVEIERTDAGPQLRYSGAEMGGHTLLVREAVEEAGDNWAVIWLTAEHTTKDVRRAALTIDDRAAGVAIDVKRHRRGIRVPAEHEESVRKDMGEKSRPPARPHWLVEGAPRNWRALELEAFLRQEGWDTVNVTHHLKTQRDGKVWRAEGDAPTSRVYPHLTGYITVGPEQKKEWGGEKKRGQNEKKERQPPPPQPKDQQPSGQTNAWKDRQKDREQGPQKERKDDAIIDQLMAAQAREAKRIRALEQRQLPEPKAEETAEETGGWKAAMKKMEERIEEGRERENEYRKTTTDKLKDLDDGLAKLFTMTTTATQEVEERIIGRLTTTEQVTQAILGEVRGLTAGLKVLAQHTGGNTEAEIKTAYATAQQQYQQGPQNAF